MNTVGLQLTTKLYHWKLTNIRITLSKCVAGLLVLVLLHFGNTVLQMLMKCYLNIVFYKIGTLSFDFVKLVK